MSAFNSSDWNRLIRPVYTPAGIKLSSTITPEAEGADYGACRFKIGEHTVLFRVAKTTPTKTGQFVTLWKRPEPGGEIAPFDASDCINFVFIIVATPDKICRGQFIFSKNILIEKGVFSNSHQPGKRAIRVYPPWSQPQAKAAIRTQQWQCQHFLDFSTCRTENRVKIQHLMGNFSKAPCIVIVENDFR